jgi:hypothetical protein
MSRSYRQYKARAAMAERQMDRAESPGDREAWRQAWEFAAARLASEREDAMRRPARAARSDRREEAA